MAIIMTKVMSSILHPSALEIALGLRPRAISRASGCKIPALRKSLGPRGVYFPIHPSSRQCTDTFPFPILGNVSHSGTLCGNVLDVSRPVSDVPGAQGEPKRATQTKKSPEVPRTRFTGPQNGRNAHFGPATENPNHRWAGATKLPLILSWSVLIFTLFATML